MRAFPLVLLSLLFTVAAASGDAPSRNDGEEAEPPKEGFTSVEELRRWAGSSSFGGGDVTTHRLGKRDIYVAWRNFTSGEPTTELSIYIQPSGATGLRRVLYQPARGIEVRSRLQDRSIVFEQYDQTKRAWVTAMTLTEHFFEP